MTNSCKVGLGPSWFESKLGKVDCAKVMQGQVGPKSGIVEVKKVDCDQVV